MDTGFFDTNVKACAECHENNVFTEMKVTSKFSHALAAYIRMLECPECGHAVPDKEYGELVLVNPDGERF